MSLNDIFRSFFGLPSRHDENSGRRDLFPFADNNDDDEDQEGFGFHGFGHMDDIFRHFQGDMMQQMEEIQRQMDDIFKNFGVTEFPAVGPSFDNGIGESERGDLRDRMLKPGTNETPRREAIEPFRSPSMFGGMFSLPNWNPVKHNDKVDQDLDSEIKVGDISKLFEKPEPGISYPSQVQPRIKSSFRSVSVQKIHKPDGTVEERRVSRDSAGNEETTVTRSLGDQSHSVTSRKSAGGEEEVVQNFKNLDEDKLPQFEKLWSPDHATPPQLMPPEISIRPDKNNTDVSLFEKFFGTAPPDFSRWK